MSDNRGFSIPCSGEKGITTIRTELNSLARQVQNRTMSKPLFKASDGGYNPIRFFQRDRRVNERRTFSAKIGCLPCRKYCGHPIYFPADIEYIQSDVYSRVP
jgi:hypothetical protein